MWYPPLPPRRPHPPRATVLYPKLDLESTAGAVEICGNVVLRPGDLLDGKAEAEAEGGYCDLFMFFCVSVEPALYHPPTRGAVLPSDHACRALIGALVIQSVARFPASGEGPLFRASCARSR